MRRRILLIGGLIFLLNAAQAIAQQDSAAVARQPRKVGVLPVPTFGASPETRLYFGAVALFTLRFWQDDSLTRISSSKLELTYTLNKQLIAEAGWNLFTRQNKWATDGLLGLRKFPENYWGIGAAQPDSVVERVDMSRLELDARGMRMIKPNLYGGLRMRLQNVFHIESESGGLIDALQPAGYLGGLSLGFGPAFSYDTRDNPLNPQKGAYAALSSLGFGRATGSDFSFSRTELEGRKYFKLGNRPILALQGYALLQTGRPPLRLMGLMGSESIMRGYYQGRYRDQNLIAFQAEYRQPLFWRLGLAVFTGAGEVWNWSEKYQMQVFKFSAGGGLRFLMDKQDKVNLRLDYAFGNGTTGFYFAFGEAF